MCVFSVQFIVFLYIFVCKCLLQNNNHKTVAKQTIILLQNNIHVCEVHCGSAVRFGQALPGLLITAHHLYASLS